MTLCRACLRNGDGDMPNGIGEWAALILSVAALVILFILDVNK